MRQYLFRRLVTSVPVLIGASVMAFLVVRIVPGDPARAVLGENASEAEVASMRRELGLDKSIPVQFLEFVKRTLMGDLGRSIRTQRPVAEDLKLRFPATVQLATASLAFALIFGGAIGMIAALRRRHLLGIASTLVALVGISLPSFWLGLLLILIFSVWLRWLPVGGRESLLSIVLPALTLGFFSSAVIARMMRASLLEVLSQDYLRTASAKGLSYGLVLTRHALKNALIPVVTVLGLEFGSLLGGAVVIETVFSWPGIGRYVVGAVTYRDYPAVQGTVIITSVVFVVINLVVDLIYGLLDPRIRFE